MKLASLGQCQQAAQGDSDAAILLFRICYWMLRATIVIDSERWIAKDRATWMREVRLSIGRYRRALAELCRLGLVETRQAHFYGRNITHLRLVWNPHRDLEMLDQGYAAVPLERYADVPPISKENTLGPVVN
jgi:hypothetical protein